MKKLFVTLLITACLGMTAGCSSPDALKMDLSRGYGEQLKLIHLNASTEEKRERIEAFGQVLEEAEPLDKDFSLFAYYPDYLLELTENGQVTRAILDVNGDYIDFYYPEEGEQLYRSQVTAEEFRKLVHQN